MAVDADSPVGDELLEMRQHALLSGIAQCVRDELIDPRRYLCRRGGPLLHQLENLRFRVARGERDTRG